MKELLRATTAYRTIRAGAARGDLSQTVLVLFPDGKLLRPLLTECAKAFFGAEDGSRTARLIGEEHFSDCLFFPAAGGKLTAEHAGRILDESMLKPVEGDRKLFVLDNFHAAAPLVQNKLLKSLEEPPEGVYFLLGAAAEHTVLPTVLSRAAKIQEPPFAEEKIFAALCRMYPSAKGAAECAAACGGVFSAAESLLSGGGEEFRLAERFLLTEEPERFCRELDEKQDKRLFFAAAALALRDALAVSLKQEKYTVRRSAEIDRIAQAYPAGALVKAISFAAEAEREIYFNANFRQCALSLAVRIRKETRRWKM